MFLREGTFVREIQSKAAAEPLLAASPLFRAAHPGSAHWAAQHPAAVYASFDPGEPVQCARTQSVGLLVTGAASCYGLSGGAQPVLLNRFAPGDLFGMAGAFASEPAPLSQIVADRRTRALFLPQELLRALFQRDALVAEAYIVYLSDRAAFLNRKIAGFTAGESVHRVAAYLAQQARLHGSPLALPCSVSELGAVLILGRASLYRAFDQLTAAGAITRTGRTFIIRDADALQRCADPDGH